MNMNIIIDKDLFKPGEPHSSVGPIKDAGAVCNNPNDMVTTPNDELVYTINFKWFNPCPRTNYLVDVERINNDGKIYNTLYEVSYFKTPAADPDSCAIAPQGEPPIDVYFAGNPGQYELWPTTEYFTVFFPAQEDMELASVSVQRCACGPIIAPPVDTSVKSLGEFRIIPQPNPVQSHTTLRYELTEAEDVSIHLMDMNMRNHQTLLSSVHQERGTHQLEIDMQHLAPGFYYCLFQTQFQQKSIKLIKVD